jgi:hypothetical protein
MLWRFCSDSTLGFDGSEQTGDNTEQRNTLDEGSRQDHRGTDITGSFWLTSDAFCSAFTDLTDTDTGSESSDTSAYSAQTVTDSSFEKNCVQQ